MTRRMFLSEWAIKRCSCMAEGYNDDGSKKRGYTNPAYGRTVGNVWSWACLNCLQAHISIFDVSEKYPREIHHETFDCIGDLPEPLQFLYWWEDEDGRPMIDDEEWSYEFDQRIGKRRRTLGLPDLASNGIDRATEQTEADPHDVNAFLIDL